MLNQYIKMNADRAVKVVENATKLPSSSFKSSTYLFVYKKISVNSGSIGFSNPKSYKEY